MGLKSISRKYVWVWLAIGTTTVVAISAISAHSNQIRQEQKQLQKQIQKDKEYQRAQQSKQPVQNGTPTMSATEIASAQVALVRGIYLKDQEHDFSRVVKGFDLPSLDLKSVTIGVDQDYLYLKFQLFQNFNEQRLLNGYTMTGTGFNANLLVEKNLKKKTQYGVGESTLFNASVNLKGSEFSNNAMALADVPNGLPESQWGNSGSTTKINVQVAGGYGHDWLMMRAPLKSLGLTIGESVIMTFGTESGSTTEYHLVLDPLMGYQNTKCGANVSFKLGETKYSLDYKGCAGSGPGGSEPVPTP